MRQTTRLALVVHQLQLDQRFDSLDGEVCRRADFRRGGQPFLESVVGRDGRDRRSLLAGPARHRFGAVGESVRPIKPLQVAPDGVHGDAEGDRDLLVGLALGGKLQDLGLAGGAAQVAHLCGRGARLRN